MSKEETAAEKAARELEEKDEKDEKDEESSDEKDEKDSEDEDSKDDDDDDEEEEDNSAAIDFYKKISDPITGPAMVEVLAKRMGLKLEGASKETQKDIIDQIDDLVSDELGPEFKIFGPKLAKILKTIVPAIAENYSKKTEDRLQENEQRRIAQEAQSALNNTLSAYEAVPKSVEKAMLRLMDEIPPVPGKTDPKKYFDRILKLAAQEKGFKLISVNGNSNSNERNERNKRDASNRLASERTSEVEKANRSSKQEFKSRRDMIEQAAKEVEKAMKK